MIFFLCTLESNQDNNNAKENTMNKQDLSQSVNINLKPIIYKINDDQG